eukprot:1160358-Pelagomonas_calceolata.AAC.10
MQGQKKSAKQNRHRSSAAMPIHDLELPRIIVVSATTHSGAEQGQIQPWTTKISASQQTFQCADFQPGHQLSPFEFQYNRCVPLQLHAQLGAAA